MTPADRQRLDRERKIRMDMHTIKYPEKCLTKGKQNISIYKYMRTKQYKEEHDTQSAQEVKERMKELFTEKQLKIIDKLAEDIFGSPKK